MIAYGSRSLNDHEKNYCTTRLEMLALVTYVDYFRYYLLGRKFCLRTDHHSLRWLTSFKEPQGQVAHWLESLQEYDFEIQHRPGKQHSNADSLSRRPRRNHGDCPSCVLLTAPQIATVTSGMSSVQHQSDEEDLWSPKNVARAQAQDSDIGPLVDQVLRDWQKPTVEELQPFSRATREICGQWSYETEYFTCDPPRELPQLRAEWSYLKGLLKKRSLKFTMVQLVPT